MSDIIYIVDDDRTNLQLAGQILSKNGMRVTGFTSGQAMLEALDNKKPDLILLDILMPGLNGFETMDLLFQKEGGKDIPVIFLTADEGVEAETKGLRMGAMDFIKKPIIPEVLVLRVRHTIDLVRLKNNLEAEVTKKTKAIEQLSIQIVETLSEAIDAKDAYTHGHSKRVAEYSMKIARRYGYSEDMVRSIYMMGLLHDVGKIGIPDAVINKAGKLTKEEYDLIKTHPPKGSKILTNIEEMPSLATGARWHHERFDGNGYPDGLSAEDIPEAARIIAVADAYDAMTSDRSYRNKMSKEDVIKEIKDGKGKQFDPIFADIMLKLIEDDEND